jgi:hypothetical protein
VAAASRDIARPAMVIGVVIGGAVGLFLGFGFVFWLFDPKAMELPGAGDFAFLITGIVTGGVLATIGGWLGRWIGLGLARFRGHPAADRMKKAAR